MTDSPTNTTDSAPRLIKTPLGARNARPSRDCAILLQRGEASRGSLDQGPAFSTSRLSSKMGNLEETNAGAPLPQTKQTDLVQNVSTEGKTPDSPCQSLAARSTWNAKSFKLTRQTHSRSILKFALQSCNSRQRGHASR